MYKCKDVYHIRHKMYKKKTFEVGYKHNVKVESKDKKHLFWYITPIIPSISSMKRYKLEMHHITCEESYFVWAFLLDL